MQDIKWISPRDSLPNDGERVAVITRSGKIYYDVFFHKDFKSQFYKFRVGSMNAGNIKGWFPMSRMEDNARS